MPKRLDDPRLSEAIIPTLVLVGLCDYAEARGLPAEPWFAGQGLSPPQAREAEAKVSFRQGSTVIRRALRSLPPGPIGLELGSRGGLVSFGMLGFAMVSCRTVQEALVIGLQHHQASGSLMDVEAEFTSPGELGLRLFERFPEPELLAFLCEEIFASCVSLMRGMVGPAMTPLRVELTYPPPPHAAAYRRLFNCPVHFNASANRLVVDAALLAQPLATHSPASLAAALDACRRLIEPALANHDVVSSVEHLLRENLRQRASMADVAARLNLTERTLRRQLVAAGESFSQIRDRVMEQRARTLLQESALAVSAIAAELGFSDLRDFRRAFRRWTGMAPTALRQQEEEL